MLASMGVSVSMLASGSRGNCAMVASSRTRILVDAGISCRETFKRMKALAEDPYSLSAVLITHEHCDHVYGLATLAKKLHIPIFMTGATHQAWARAMRDQKGERPQLDKLEKFESGHSFQVGDIAVKPFTIPHDAADPVGLTFRADGIKVGIATDLGWEPQETFESGLRKTVAWYLANRTWWERVTSGAYRQYYDSQYKQRLSNAV